MKNSVLKALLIFALAIFTSTSLLASENPTPIDDCNKCVNFNSSGEVASVAIAQCCDEELDFEKKLEISLCILKCGYGIDARISNAGNRTFYDFYKGHKVARLVVIESEQKLMMIQRELQV